MLAQIQHGDATECGRLQGDRIVKDIILTIQDRFSIGTDRTSRHAAALDS